MWVMERVEGTESRGIVVYRVNCVGYGASWRYREQGDILVYTVNCVGYRPS